MTEWNAFHLTNFFLVPFLIEYLRNSFHIRLWIDKVHIIIKLQYLMKVVNYSINTFYVLEKQYVCDLQNYFWKSGNLSGLVAFQVRLLSMERTGTVNGTLI